MMKTVFHFMLKAIFVLDLCTFCLNFVVLFKNILIRWIINSKIYDVIDWITNYYNKHVANISRSICNQAVQFSQLL